MPGTPYTPEAPHAVGYRIIAPSGQTLDGPFDTRDDAIDVAEGILRNPDYATPALECYGVGIIADLSDDTTRYAGSVTL